MIFRERPEGFSPKFNIVSCFCEHGGKILLLQRHSENSHPFEWGVPAGKAAEGEDITDAVLREIEEETGMGLNPGDLKFFTTLYVSHYGYNIIYHIFHTKLDSKPDVKINRNEHKDFSWVSPDKALGMNLIADLDSCIRLFYGV